MHLKIGHHFLHTRQKLMMFVDEENHIYIATPTYNFFEFSGNYLDTLGSFKQFKYIKFHLTMLIWLLFKYKAALPVKQQRLLIIPMAL